MDLATILLFTAGALTLLSGCAVFFGSEKADRKRTLFYLIATICGAGWTWLIIRDADLSYIYVAALAMVLSFTTFVKLQKNSALMMKSKRVKNANKLCEQSLVIFTVLMLILDVFLPNFYQCNFLPVSPLLLAVMIVVHYYAVLRYHIINLSSTWLKILSYIILITAGVAFYMVVFYVVVTVLFKIQDLSAAIIAINFIMITIVLIMIPLMEEFITRVRSLISVQQVDVTYIVKKLNRLATQNINLTELSTFLADHLHFHYIGFLINGRLYGSKSLGISGKSLQILEKMPVKKDAIWLDLDDEAQKLFEKNDLRAAADLKNAKGKTFGQMIVGKSLGKTSFEKRDLIQLEMIVNLVAAVIDSEKHLRS